MLMLQESFVKRVGLPIEPRISVQAAAGSPVHERYSFTCRVQISLPLGFTGVIVSDGLLRWEVEEHLGEVLGLGEHRPVPRGSLRKAPLGTGEFSKPASSSQEGMGRRHPSPSSATRRSLSVLTSGDCVSR